MPISNYLPPAGAIVRIRVEQPGAVRSPSWLVPVAQLPHLAAANPRAKISVTYAALEGGEYDENVTEVTAVAIDLDVKPGHATAEQVTTLRERFPGAGCVWSNGVTLLYRLEGLPWEIGLILAYQIAREAEATTGLGYDVTTHYKKDGTPGKQRNHLFRFAAGWASRRSAAVEFFEPIDPTRSLADDATGLNHATIQPHQAKAKTTAVVGDLFD